MQNKLWYNKRVLVTGHTGFKGGWLSLWLKKMGADVHGIALSPNTQPSFYELTKIEDQIAGRLIDLKDYEAIKNAVLDIRPQVVFHLAAQPLVRKSYDEPITTFSTNVMGTAHLLEACRAISELEAVICITTDKVYDNREWVWSYRENDNLGGKDPYSASKACVEHLVNAYRSSFYNSLKVPIVTARGGNVIGGGDWGEERLVPDLVRAVGLNAPLEVRSPNSIRPWQHVLVLCHGYLALAEGALSEKLQDQSAWNFGPLESDFVSVNKLLSIFKEVGYTHEVYRNSIEEKPESKILSLDSSLARAKLEWQPELSLNEAVAWTAQWYQKAQKGASMRDYTISQIETYCKRLVR